MSKTKLDPEVRTEVIDRARDSRGRIRCQGWPTGTCGRIVEVGGFEIDHIVPETASAPEMRSDPANLQVLCAPKGKQNQDEGCHRKKTRQEARARAKANRTPRQRRRGAVTGVVGLVASGYAASLLLAGPDAARGFLRGCLGVAVAAVLLFVAVNVYIAWGERAPRESEKPDAGTVPDPGTVPITVDAKRIETAFREACAGGKGTVKVTVTSNDAFSIHYPDTGFDDAKEAEGRAKLVDRINAKLEPDRWKPRWATGVDTVHFTRRPDLPNKIPHPGLPNGRRWHEIPIGPNASFDLMKTSHILIIGVTNAGKTSLIRAIIAAVADSARHDDNAEMILCDPKLVELLGFAGWEGLRRIVTDTKDLWDMAMDLEEEMNRRFRLLKEKKVPLSSHKRLIVIVDEYEQYFKRMRRLWQNGDPEWEGKPTEDPYRKKTGQTVPPPIDAMQSVLSMARKAGIHVIIGTQSPDATWFGGSGTRENLQGRAAVGPIDRIRAVMAFGDSSIGRDLPVEAKGRATVQMLEGDAEEVQTYWVPDPFDSDGDNTEEDWAILARLGYRRQKMDNE